MRIECDHCSRLAPANLAAAASGAIAHVCTMCGATSTFTPAAAPGAPVAAGRECPKCGLRPVVGEGCTRCGLATDRMDGFAPDEQVPDELGAAWDACRAAWDEPDSHERVATLALTHERYPWLARRYRTVLRERPGDPIATARLQRIGRMAEAALRATAGPSIAAPGRRTGMAVILIIVLLMLAGGMIYAVRVIAARRSDAGATGTRTPAAPAPRKAPAAPRVPSTPIESPSSGR